MLLDTVILVRVEISDAWHVLGLIYVNRCLNVKLENCMKYCMKINLTATSCPGVNWSKNIKFEFYVSSNIGPQIYSQVFDVISETRHNPTKYGIHYLILYKTMI